MRIRTFWLSLCVLGLLLASCGAPDTDTEIATGTEIASAPAASSAATVTATVTATTTPEPTATPEPTSTPEPTAEPTATPIRSAVEPAAPARIQIPAIDLDYKPVSVGLDKNRIPIVLDHDVAWYNLSAMPGQGDNIVFWGHVLRFKATPNIPAPFARVEQLKPGAEIIVTTEKGEQVTYRVTQSVQVTPDQVQYILPTGKEQITLVSCIGDKVISNGLVTKSHRLVTIADLAQ